MPTRPQGSLEASAGRSRARSSGARRSARRRGQRRTGGSCRTARRAAPSGPYTSSALRTRPGSPQASGTVPPTQEDAVRAGQPRRNACCGPSPSRFARVHLVGRPGAQDAEVLGQAGRAGHHPRRRRRSAARPGRGSPSTSPPSNHLHGGDAESRHGGAAVVRGHRRHAPSGPPGRPAPARWPSTRVRRAKRSDRTSCR